MYFFINKLCTSSHWGRGTHTCISNLTIIGSDNGLMPCRHQAIIGTNAEILLFGPFGTNFSEILIEITTFSFKKMCLKVSSAKQQPFRLGLNVLTNWGILMPYNIMELDPNTGREGTGLLRTMTKPLHELMLTYCQLDSDPQEQI